MRKTSSNPKGRPKAVPKVYEIREVARLFYKLDMTRQEIGKQLGIEPRTVKLFLELAEELGIVRIDIRTTPQDELVDRLRAQFPHITDAIVLSGSSVEDKGQYDQFVRSSTVAAANYLDGHLNHHARNNQPFHVGVSGGETVLEIVRAIAPRNWKNAYVYPTAIVGMAGSFHVTPLTNAVFLWNKFGHFDGCLNYTTISPYYADGLGPEARLSIITKELPQLEQSPFIRDAIIAMDKIDVAFADISPVISSSNNPLRKDWLSMTDILRPIVEPRQLAAEGAIANFSYCLIDADGNANPDWQFFMTAGHYSKRPGIEFYKHMVDEGKRVVVAAGPGKISEIKIALEAKAFNVWFTDEPTARQILEMPSSRRPKAAKFSSTDPLPA